MGCGDVLERSAEPNGLLAGLDQVEAAAPFVNPPCDRSAPRLVHPRFSHRATIGFTSAVAVPGASSARAQSTNFLPAVSLPLPLAAGIVTLVHRVSRAAMYPAARLCAAFLSLVFHLYSMCISLVSHFF